ncbi:MAG: carboxymuconolactone decarboxylase family protein [candidate division Zixibacteria bacterium]|nr:carboxymuconolactone decarboxylase family protein [candidate division Zixibacteria bacterium]
MKNLNVLTNEQASPEVQAIFAAITKKYGKVPNLYAVTANSPVALKAVLDYGDTLGTGEFTAKEQESVALVVAQVNGCQYCLAAHTAVGKMLGFSKEETLSIRSGNSDDPKLGALVALAGEIVLSKGWPAQKLVDDFFAAGFSKAALVELIGLVSLNVFKNYLNHVADAPLDFDEVQQLKQEAVV